MTLDTIVQLKSNTGAAAQRVSDGILGYLRSNNNIEYTSSIQEIPKTEDKYDAIITIKSPESKDICKLTVVQSLKHLNSGSHPHFVLEYSISPQMLDQQALSIPALKEIIEGKYNNKN